MTLVYEHAARFDILVTLIELAFDLNSYHKNNVSSSSSSTDDSTVVVGFLLCTSSWMLFRVDHKGTPWQFVRKSSRNDGLCSFVLSKNIPWLLLNCKSFVHNLQISFLSFTSPFPSVSYRMLFIRFMLGLGFVNDSIHRDSNVTSHNFTTLGLKRNQYGYITGTGYSVRP